MAPKPGKRKASSEQVQSIEKKPKVDKAMSALPKLHIPPDEGFNGEGTANAKVYVDGDNVVFDVCLNQTNISGNNNKFYRIQVLEADAGTAFWTHTRWGRVGSFGQKATFGPFSDFDNAFHEFIKKFKDKTGLRWENRLDPPKSKKYTYIERSYSEDGEDQVDSDDEPLANSRSRSLSQPSTPPPSKLPVPVQDLVRLIFNQDTFNDTLEALGYNANKLPLGKLGKNTLKIGFTHLQELADLIADPARAQAVHGVSYDEAIHDFSNRYYSTIPHEFGRNRPPAIGNQDILRKEVEMLDTLIDMEVANTIMGSSQKAKVSEADEQINMLDQRFQGLGLNEMTCLEHKSDEFNILSEYLTKSKGETHAVDYKLEEIFRIERHGENDRFGRSKYAKVKSKNRRLLWHGSRTANFGGILSQGLRIAPPEAPVNGYAFGKGVYLADISSKSAQYCLNNAGRGTGLLLLCEAELGNPMYEISSGDSRAEEHAKKSKCISTMGVGRVTPLGWRDGNAIREDLAGVQFPDASKGIGENQAADKNGYLYYNEYICYDVAQIRLRYLFRVRM